MMGTYFSRQEALEHITVIYFAMHIDVDVINGYHHLGGGGGEEAEGQSPLISELKDSHVVCLQ